MTQLEIKTSMQLTIFTLGLFCVCELVGENKMKLNSVENFSLKSKQECLYQTVAKILNNSDIYW